jgi:hypothetical protein
MNSRKRQKHRKTKVKIQTANRIKDWLPLLKEDRDYDYGFLEDIIIFKLKRMSKCIRRNQLVTDHNTICRRIDYAVYLFERIKSQYDTELYKKEFNDKWGDTKYSFEEIIAEKADKRKYRIMKTTYSKANTPELHEQAETDSRKMYLDIAAKEDELYDRLFKHLGKYWRTLWD